MSSKKTTLTLFSCLGLFVTLGCWAISGPLGAGPRLDPDHHISSIWCAWGESSGVCENLGPGGNFGYKAEVPFMFSMCEGRPIDYWQKCSDQAAQPEMQELRTSFPINENLYYKIMHIFASEQPTQSILGIRLLNVLLFAFMFLLMQLLLSPRQLKAATTSWLIMLFPVGSEILTSVNPRAWSYIGVMSGWVFLQEIFVRRRENHAISVSLLFAYLFSAFLCVSTRWDATLYFLITSGFVVIINMNLKILQKNRSQFVIIALLSSPILFFASQRAPVLSSFFSLPTASYLSKPQMIFFYVANFPSIVSENWKQPPQYAGGTSQSILILSVVLIGAWCAHTLRKYPTGKIWVPLTLGVFLVVTVVRGAFFWQELLGIQGEYFFGLIVALIGIISIWSEEPDFLFRSRATATTYISMISLVNFFALFNYLEFYVRKGENIGSFESISLSGGWWWNSIIGPNFVLLVATVSLPASLICLYKSKRYDNDNSLIHADRQ